MHKVLSYLIPRYHRILSSNINLYARTLLVTSKPTPNVTNLPIGMVLLPYNIIIIIKVIYNSELLRKASLYYTLIYNYMPTSNNKKYVITTEHASKLVPCDTNLLSLMVLLPYFIMIKVMYNSESLHKSSHNTLILCRKGSIIAADDDEHGNSINNKTSISPSPLPDGLSNLGTNPTDDGPFKPLDNG